MSTTNLLQRLAAANTDGMAAPEGSAAFAGHILTLLDRVEYRRCETGEDMEDVFRLRYKAYLRSGMVGPHASGMIHDAMDEVPNAMCFGIYLDGQLVSTLRMHRVTAAHQSSPSTSVYGDLILPRVEAGLTFLDTSRFAVDPDHVTQVRVMPYVTVRLVAMACVYSSPDYGLLTIRPDHAAFYRRVFNAELIGPLRDYPALNYPVVLYETDLERIGEQTLARHPYFRSSPMEQRLMFGETPFGEAPPLTILPTAKYMVRAA